MVRLEQVSKVYRTERIETTALEELARGAAQTLVTAPSCRSWAPRGAARARC